MHAHTNARTLPPYNSKRLTSYLFDNELPSIKHSPDGYTDPLDLWRWPSCPHHYSKYNYSLFQENIWLISKRRYSSLLNASSLSVLSKHCRLTVWFYMWAWGMSQLSSPLDEDQAHDCHPKKKHWWQNVKDTYVEAVTDWCCYPGRENKQARRQV